jgi:hypothetical protein
MARKTWEKWDEIGDLANESHIDARDLEAWADDIEGRRPDDDATPEEIDESDWTEDDAATLKALRGILDDLDMRNDPALINESEWSDYARQCADDYGYVSEAGPLARYVDWDRWADDLKGDYSVIEIAGTTFYYQD